MNALFWLEKLKKWRSPEHFAGFTLLYLRAGILPVLLKEKGLIRMKNIFLLLCGVCLVVLSTQSFAQDRFTGVMTLTFGHVKNHEGQTINVQGFQVPYVAERIYAQRIERGEHPPKMIFEGNAGGRAVTYLNDNGDGSYFYYPQNPSSLDDFVLAVGTQGLPWKHLTTGINAEASHKFLIRWKCFDTFVSGLGIGVSAFYDVFADFGGYVTLPGVGAWKVTFDISVVGATNQDGTCFIAQQFREPIPTGEGAFDPAYSSIFSGGGVSVGNSEDYFYDDSYPTSDGIYDETEIDFFGGPPNHANYLFGLTTGGTQTTIVPESYTIEKGVLVSGSLSRLWYSDDLYMVINDAPADFREAPIRLVIESVSPSSNIISMTVIMEAKVNKEGAVQRIELWNYQMNKWDLVDTRSAALEDSVAYWTSGSSPAKYVQSGTNKVKARFTFKPALSPQRLQATIDQTIWKVVTP